MKGECREGQVVNVRYYSRDVDIALIDDRSECWSEVGGPNHELCYLPMGAN
jgi:hypothetical protein